MPSSYTAFGPGTVTIGAGTLDFSCEVLGGAVTHEYEDVGESRTTLCGEQRPAGKRRSDGLKFSVENDLTASGLYQFLVTNDLTEQGFVYTPNTADAAKWEGTVLVTLPAEIGADEFGAPIASDVEWAGTGGAFTFTAAT